MFTLLFSYLVGEPRGPSRERYFEHRRLLAEFKAEQKAHSRKPSSGGTSRVIGRLRNAFGRTV